MSLSVMVREPGNQDGTEIGVWSCYLVVPIPKLINTISIDWLGINPVYYIFFVFFIK